CRWVPKAMVQQARPRVSLTGTIPSFRSYTPMSPSSVSGHSLLEESAVAHAWSVAASRTAKRLRVIVGSAPREVITAATYTDRRPFGKVNAIRARAGPNRSTPNETKNQRATARTLWAHGEEPHP